MSAQKMNDSTLRFEQKNENLRDKLEVPLIEDKERKQSKMVWSCIKDSHKYNKQKYDCQRLHMYSRDRQRPKTNWLEVFRIDVMTLNLTDEIALNRTYKIHIVDPS